MNSSFHHTRVLLRKEWLILRRQWFYLVMFTVVPLLMTGTFWFIEQSLSADIQDEKHNIDMTKYSKINYKSESFLGSGMDKRHRSHSGEPGAGNLTAMTGCSQSKHKDVGLIAPKHLTNAFHPFLEKEFGKSISLCFEVFIELSFIALQNLHLHIFESVEQLIVDINENRHRLYCFGFEISQVTPRVHEVNITVYFARDSLSGIVNTFTPLYDQSLKNPDWTHYNRTMGQGTPHFMIVMADFLLMMMRGHRMQEIELAFIPMKTPEFKQLPPIAAEQLKQAFPLFFLAIFLPVLYYLVTRLAEEKESKAREGMKMMGLTDSTYYIGWFIFNAFIVIYTVQLIVAILQLEVFARSNSWMLLLMFTVYGLQLFGFAFTFVAIFPTKKASTTAASAIHFAAYFVYYWCRDTAFVYRILLACFVPNFAVGCMLAHLLHLEIDAGVGLDFQTALLPYRQFTFLSGFACQIMCGIVWATIGIYFDQVMLREFGRSQPWNFLWKKEQIKDRTNSQIKSEGPHHQQIGNTSYLKNLDQLRIEGLTKKYSNGTIAVNDVSMTMQKGQIFALLGHNGAGKTTTISMLTGLTEPTSGSAIMDGYNIFTDSGRLRESLGVCPQHNVLFGELTVREHLELFCTLKGKKSIFEINRRVDKMISQLELEDVQGQASHTLSGGQKRKLSVGIALIGDAKVIILDEPTSGMDTTTRRRFWEIIKSYRKNRIIILTTHYMDEAEVLGDQICIMAEGRVQCCGTSLSLKTKFGIGYNLTFTKTEKTNVRDISAYMRDKLPEAMLLQDVSSEITWRLPENSRSKFKSFFGDLDKDLSKLNLTYYSFAMTTLEEVFLRIGQKDQNGKSQTIESIKQKTADLNKLTKREKMLVDYSIAQEVNKSFRDQLFKMVQKKILIQVRDFKSCLLDLLLPCLVIIGGLYISKLPLVSQGHPLRNLSLYEFPRGKPLIYNQDSSYQSQDEGLARFIDEGFGVDIGPGKLWSNREPFQANQRQKWFDQVLQMDAHLFNSRNQSGPFFAEFYVQQALKQARTYSIASFVNVSQPHAALSAAGYMLQAVMRDQLDNPNFRLNYQEAQLPFSLEWQFYIETGVGLLSSIGVAIAYMMISDTLICSLIKEKKLAIKHQIMISGGSNIAYWLSHYLIDLLTHTLPAFVSLYMIDVYKIDAPNTAYLFTSFCFANPLFVYVLCFFFTNDSIASIFIRLFYLGFGVVAPIAIQVLMVISKQTIAVAVYLKSQFRLVPIFNLLHGYISVISRNKIELTTAERTQPLDWDCAGEALAWIWYMAGVSLIILYALESNLYRRLFRRYYKPMLTVLAMIDESLKVKKPRKVYDIREIAGMEDWDHLQQPQQIKINDQDPRLEEIRVKSVQRAAVIVRQLSKSYKPFQKAVDNLSFALDYGECFALLGITGAGKTTTFKSLCREEIPDEGSLLLANHDVSKEDGFSRARSMVGYCPQFDALYELLTVREHLKFYAAIKGVRADYQDELVEMQIRELDLWQYRDLHAGKLSGGNKRKLSCAVALIGNPPLILLDEPSTGVDPQAKRFMWTVISNLSTQRRQSTVVLTTHSMEEAEALCSKIGIMVDGRFQCYGSAQQIKEKYASGFEIDLQIAQPNDQKLKEQLQKLNASTKTNVDVNRDLFQSIQLDDGFEQVQDRANTNYEILLKDPKNLAFIQQNGLKLQNELETVFGECHVVEYHDARFRLKVERNNYSIGFVYGLMEQLRPQYSISEYQVNQTTLEQIFNMFATQKGVTERR